MPIHLSTSHPSFGSSNSSSVVSIPPTTLKTRSLPALVLLQAKVAMVANRAATADLSKDMADNKVDMEVPNRVMASRVNNNMVSRASRAGMANLLSNRVAMARDLPSKVVATLLNRAAGILLSKVVVDMVLPLLRGTRRHLQESSHYEGAHISTITSAHSKRDTISDSDLECHAQANHQPEMLI